jgi:hypothetical protein
MSCCGRNRASVVSPASQAHDPRASTPATVTLREKAIGAPNGRIRYVGAQPLSVRGPRTGRVYYFAEAGPAEVHEKDIDALLRTGLFERAGVSEAG